MTTPDPHDDLTWIVLRNAQGQYSLWPACRTTPAGWAEVGPEGDAAECSSWVDVHWKFAATASGA